MDSKGGTLVVGPAWVGDMVMAQSLFKTLKARERDRAIDVVAPPWSLPLLGRMPEVRAGVELAVGHGELQLAERIRLGRSLQQRQYNKSIVLPRSWKSALVPWLARVPHRIGYRGEMRYGLINDMRPLDKSVLSQTVQRYVALGLEASEKLPSGLPYPRLVDDPENARRLVKEFGLEATNPVVALLPGAEYGPAKQWPTEHFMELARNLGELGVQSWIFGSAKERDLGEIISQGGGGAIRNLCGKTGLTDAIDLLSLTTVAVTNDSGLMHIAAALSLPVVAIYGSSSPEFTPPLSRSATILTLGLECSPCFDRVCRLGHTNCLRGIAPHRALSAVQKYVS